MSEINLQQIDINGLKVFSNHCDLRKDLHLFMDYVGNLDVKRTTRENSLPKMDARRLAKLISDPLAPEEVEDSGYSNWLDYIDDTALKLGFISYDTEGKYLGYTSSEPSYPDNYIEIDEQKYNSFLNMSLQDQENQLLKSLVDKYTACNNEFFDTGVMGTLDTFSSRGCETGVLPYLNFAKIRNFLLKIMQRCQSGVWYSSAFFVRYLKAEHPFFLSLRNRVTSIQTGLAVVMVILMKAKMASIWILRFHPKIPMPLKGLKDDMWNVFWRAFPLRWVMWMWAMENPNTKNGSRP